MILTSRRGMQGFGAYAADTSGAERDNFDYVVASNKGDTLEMDRITATTVAGASAMAAARAAADLLAAQQAADAVARKVSQGAASNADFVAAMAAATAAANKAAQLRASAAATAAQQTAAEAAQATAQQAAIDAQQAAAAQVVTGNALTTTVNPETDFTAGGGATGSPPNLIGWLSANPSALWIGGAAVLGLVLLLRRR